MSRASLSTANYLQVAAAALATPTPITYMCWFNPTSTALGTATSIGDTNSAHYVAIGQDGTGRVFLETATSGPNTSDAFSTGTMSTGTWNHIAGVSSSVTSHIAYLNGTAGVTETTSVTPVALDRTIIGHLFLNNTRISGSTGIVAHVAIWNIALSGAEITSLAAGRNPLTIQPNALVGYWPLAGNDSPEPDSVNITGPMVITGSPTKGASDPLVDPPPSLGGDVLWPDVNFIGPTSDYGPNPFQQENYPPFAITSGNVIFDMAGVLATLNFVGQVPSLRAQITSLQASMTLTANVAQEVARVAPGVATMNLQGIVPTKERIVTKPPVATQTWSAQNPAKLTAKHSFSPQAIITFVGIVGTPLGQPVVFNMGTTQAIINLNGIVPTKLRISANSAQASLTLSALSPIDKIFAHPIIAPLNFSATVPIPRVRTSIQPIASFSLTAQIPTRVRITVSPPTAILRFNGIPPTDNTSSPIQPFRKIHAMGKANTSGGTDTISR